MDCVENFVFVLVFDCGEAFFLVRESFREGGADSVYVHRPQERGGAFLISEAFAEPFQGFVSGSGNRIRQFDAYPVGDPDDG